MNMVLGKKEKFGSYKVEPDNYSADKYKVVLDGKKIKGFSLKADAVKFAKKMQPKYKIGDMVYSYANKDYKAKIRLVFESDDEKFKHKYVLKLKDGDSPKISEESLSKTKK